MVRSVMPDIRYALRQLRRSPAFTAAAVLTLALGIGANSALFSLLDAALLKRLPVPNPEQLVSIIVSTRSGGWMTNVPAPLFERLREDPRAFAGVLAFWRGTETVRWEQETEQLLVQLVSPEYYSTLGVTAFAGRLIAPADQADADNAVAVLDYRFWRRAFRGDPNAIGRSLVVDGIPRTIIGVTRPGFFGTDRGASPDVTVPLGDPRRFANLWVMARLKPGVSLERARTEVDFAWQRAAESLKPRLERLRKSDREAVLSQRGDLLPGSRSGGRLGLRSQIEPLAILALLSATLMLIGCANIANLLLARSVARAPEIGTRLAMGATRGRIVRQLLVESGVLALVGAALGVPFGFAAHRVLTEFIFAEGVPSGALFALDSRLLVFTFVASAVCTVALGLLPAIRSARLDVTPLVKRSAASYSARSGTVGGHAFVFGQVAACVVLLAAAGLLARTLGNLRTLDRGFVTDRLLLVGIEVPRGGAGLAPAVFYQGLLSRAEAVPGVASASLGGRAVFGPNLWVKSVWVQGRPADERQQAAFNVVSPGFFATTGTPLRIGRDFSAHDDVDAPPVAIVNESFVRAYCPDGNPLGCRFGDGGPGGDGRYEIIGVVKDVKFTSLRESAEPMIYQALMQDERAGSVTLHARIQGSPAGLAAQVRQELQGLDPRVAVHEPRTAAAEIDDSLRQDRMMATLSTAFAVSALVLTCIGLFGVVACQVQRRTKEIGIRIALGATRLDVLRVTLGRTLTLVALGAATGAVVAIPATKALRSFLFGVAPADPATLAAVVVLLAAVATAAAYLPTRRAAALDPTVALRHE